MALDLEKIRRTVAEVKGVTFDSGEPQLEGVSKELWEERKTLNAELGALKAHSEGRDETPGTPEYLRIQEIGKEIQKIEIRLEELGVRITKGIDALKKAIERKGMHAQSD